MLISTAFLAVDHSAWFVAFLCQLMVYLIAIMGFSDWAEKLPFYSIFRKPISFANYFLLGQLGTFLGVVDFFRGKRVDRWAPEKS